MKEIHITRRLIKMKTINGGKVMSIDSFKYDALEAEVLSKEISGHGSDILVHYFMEDGKKVAICLSYNEAGDTEIIEEYRFKKEYDLQHYWSRAYMNRAGLPKKYDGLIDMMSHAHVTARNKGFFRNN
jgi:hypothetical protein